MVLCVSKNWILLLLLLSLALVYIALEIDQGRNSAELWLNYCVKKGSSQNKDSQKLAEINMMLVNHTLFIKR